MDLKLGTGIAVAAMLCTITACSGPADPPSATEIIAEVTTTPAVAGDLPDVVTGFGAITFDPGAQRLLVAEIEARVHEVLVLPGVAVGAGEAVLRLLPSSSSNVEIARTSRDAITADAAAARARRLRADGLASDADVEAAETTARDLQTLSRSLAGRSSAIAELRSPIDGIVDALLVEPGSVVAPGAQLARIVSPGAIQARVAVEVEDVARLKVGASVVLQALDNTDTELSSTVHTIDHRVDPATRAASVYVVVPPGSGLLPGEAVRAAITVAVRKGVVLVPRQSVFADESGSYLYVNDNGTASIRRITVGISGKDVTEVTAGLKVGKDVIVEGAAILADGMHVRTVRKDSSTTP